MRWNLRIASLKMMTKIMCLVMRISMEKVMIRGSLRSKIGFRHLPVMRISLPWKLKRFRTWFWYPIKL